MNEFDDTDILEEEDSIGFQLKEAREAKNLSLENLHDLTKIKIIHLQAMEENRFEQIAAPVYQKGFLKSVAKALDLNAENLINQYKKQYEVKELPLNLVNTKKSQIKPKVIFLIGAALIVLILALFLIF